MHFPEQADIDPIVITDQMEHQDAGIRSLEGTIQRVNYQKRELSVIAVGRPYHFALSWDCELWFNGRRASFRCFQSLDHVRISYETLESGLVAKALYLWAPEPAATD